MYNKLIFPDASLEAEIAEALRNADRNALPTLPAPQALTQTGRILSDIPPRRDKVWQVGLDDLLTPKF